MRPEELVALGDVAGAAAGGLAGRVQDMHAGIAERVFGAVGPGADPVRTIHDGIAGAVYKTIRVSVPALARAGTRAASTSLSPDAPALDDSPRARIALGALNGAFGDSLRRRGNALAVPMTVRRGNRDVWIQAGLAADFPDATPRLAVFLHGLCETDEAWMLGARRQAPYGPRLRADLGYTPVYIRYNTGLHISENGRELARLLGEVVDGWPEPAAEIALIGHSMGGLVARSACHYGAGSAWVANVRHVFTLGSPHAGAPLEQAANVAGAMLAMLPETRSLSKALAARSAGIKDLRFGSLLDEDWLDRDPDVFLRNTCRQIPFLAGANHYFVCATLSRSAEAPVGRVVGDLLVLRASAWAHGGRGQRMRFPVDHYRHVGGANHFDLLNHPAVYEQILRWIAGRPALPAPCSSAISHE